MSTTTTTIYLSNNKLHGLDDHLDSLTSLFEQLQVATVETAHPSLDLLTFSESAYYFAVIMLKQEKHQSILPVQSQKQLAFSSLAKQRRLNKHLTKLTQQESQHLQDDPNQPQPGWTYYDPPQINSKRPSSPPLDPLPNDQLGDLPIESPIGLIYLTSPYTFLDDPLHCRQLNVGIILSKQYRGKGYARQAISLVLKKAFQEAQCHRVQAILPEHVAKDRAICLFTQMRFDHEGTRRYAFYSPLENTFKDVTYMGMLDFDWAIREKDTLRRAPPNPNLINPKVIKIITTAIQPPPPLQSKSVWDELFSRHQREREELLNWESGIAIRNSVSRIVRAQTPTQSDFRGIKHEDEDLEYIEGKGKGKANAMDTDDDDGGYETATTSSSASSSFSDAFPPSPSPTPSTRYWSESESDGLSTRSSPAPAPALTIPNSATVDQWDMIEPPSESESDVSAVSSFGSTSGSAMTDGSDDDNDNRADAGTSANPPSPVQPRGGYTFIRPRPPVPDPQRQEQKQKQRRGV